MATVRNRAAVKRYMAEVPEKLTETVLRGAARATGGVVLDEAKARVTSDEVRAGLVMKTRAKDMRITVTISVKPGWARSLGTWLEYGTAPHFITVDDSQRQGMSAGRINRLEKKGTLVINGKPVGRTVHHPGARPHPFLRVSLDLKIGDAIAAGQSYINANLGRLGIGANGGPAIEDGE